MIKRSNRAVTDTPLVSSRREENKEWKSYYQKEYPKFWRRRVTQYGFTRYHRIVLRHLNPQPGEVILECGIGTGQPLAKAVAEAGAKVHGVDIASSILEECRAQLMSSQEKVDLCSGDVEALPYLDNTFDKVYAISTTWCLPNLEQALAEMSRVVRPGGLLLFDALNLLHITAFYGALIRRLKRRLGLYAHPLISRSPWRIRKILASLPVNYREEGYYPFIPPNLPLVHLEVGKYLPFWSYGLARSAIKMWGAKLIYTCEKK